MELKALVIKTLKEFVNHLKSAGTARTGLEKTDINKMMKALRKESQIVSPKLPFAFILFNLLLMTLLFSCQRDAETKTGKDILTSNSWKISAHIMNGVEMVIEECLKDDYVTFAANGTYTDFRGLLKCPGGIQTDVNGTWTLSQDEKILTLTNFQGVTSYSAQITESKLTLTYAEDDETNVLICIPYI